MEKEMYGKFLKEGKLSFESIVKLLKFVKNKGMKIEKNTSKYFKRTKNNKTSQ